MTLDAPPDAVPTVTITSMAEIPYDVAADLEMD
jgi:hypothetical protein